MEQGLPQGFFLPHERPNLDMLRMLGFAGTDEEVFNQAGKRSPSLLKNVYSASSMWAANAATFSPSIDSYDKNIHITPANFNSMFHRSIDPEFTKKQLEMIYPEIDENLRKSWTKKCFINFGQMLDDFSKIVHTFV